jgi:hypothetical protein
MSKIKLNLVNDVWCVETTFYGVHVVAHDSHLQITDGIERTEISHVIHRA